MILSGEQVLLLFLVRNWRVLRIIPCNDQVLFLTFCLGVTLGNSGKFLWNWSLSNARQAPYLLISLLNNDHIQS